jgi:hypothetical protein
MAQLVIRDAATGVVQLDISTRLPRILGQVQVTGDGSLDHDGFATGTPFARVMYAGADPDAISAYLPFASFDGDTMTWTFPGASAGPSMIIYGVY